LANGTYIQADCCSKQEALLDPKTLTWTATGTGKFDIHDEEGRTLLPNKHVLTVDAYVFQYNPTEMNSEFYNPASGKWQSAGSTGVQLWDSAALWWVELRLTRAGPCGPAARRDGLLHRSESLRRRPYCDLQGDLDHWSGFS